MRGDFTPQPLNFAESRDLDALKLRDLHYHKIIQIRTELAKSMFQMSNTSNPQKITMAFDMICAFWNHHLTDNSKPHRMQQMTKLIVNKGPLPDRVSIKKEPPYPFDEMAIGDWLYVDGIVAAERVQNAGHAYGIRSKTGFRLSRRKDPEVEDCYFLVRAK